MKDITIKQSNPAYKEFLNEKGDLLFSEAIYSSSGHLMFSSKGTFSETGGKLFSIKIEHQNFVHSAMYKVSFKRKSIYLQFMKLTVEES